MKKWVCILLVISVLGAFFSACSEETFQGSVTESENEFRMEYTILNQTKTGTLVLGAGDLVRVALDHTAGSVDIRVGIPGETTVYEGSALGNAGFTLNIQKAGRYEISVTGFGARGSVSFTRTAAMQNAEATEQSDPPESVDAEEMINALAAYQFALQQISFEHIYPDGTDTGFDGTYGYIEDNFFAIQDVNDDGNKELIVRFITASEAGKQETMYSCIPGEGSLQRLLTISPDGVYYDNGIVKENWAHGSGLCSEEYWPYTLYRYDETEKTYVQIADVNMWSRSVAMVNYKGDPYPDEIDAENAGTVFIVYYQGETETISKSVYEAWLAEILGNARPLQIAWRDLSEKNIQNLYG